MAEGMRRRLWAREVSLIDVWPWACASLSFVLCQKLDSLIRLLDITDTSHGAPYSEARVTLERLPQKGVEEESKRREAERREEEPPREGARKGDS